jgi:hypothetical protein
VRRVLTELARRASAGRWRGKRGAGVKQKKKRVPGGGPTAPQLDPGAPGRLLVWCGGQPRLRTPSTGALALDRSGMLTEIQTCLNTPFNPKKRSVNAPVPVAACVAPTHARSPRDVWSARDRPDRSSRLSVRPALPSPCTTPKVANSLYLSPTAAARAGTAEIS